MTYRNADQYEVEEFPPCPGEGDVCFRDWVELESEDKVGCARGIVWAIIFEAALAAAALIYWKFHLWPH